MKSKTNTTIALKILISLIAIAILGTIGCSNGSSNPVTAGLEEPQAMTNPDLSDSAEAPGDLELAAARDAQITWYEYSESATEPNDDYTTAHQVYHAQAFNGYIDDDIDQNDYFKIAVCIIPATIYVHLDWDSDAWVNLYIYEEFDGVLTPVVYDNYDTASPKELFEYELPPGTYYVRVKGFEGIANYQIRFGVGRQLFETSNNSFSTPWDVTPGTLDGPVRSVISNSEDASDYMYFEVMEDDTRLVAELDWVGLAGTDLSLTLYNSSYGYVASIGGTAAPKTLVSPELSPGLYFLRVNAAANEAIYELDVDLSPILLPLDPGKWKIFEWRPWDPFPPDPPFRIDNPGCPMDPVEMPDLHVPMQFH